MQSTVAPPSTSRCGAANGTGIGTPIAGRGERELDDLIGIVLTHGHNDHINAAVPLRDLVDAPILLHDADRMLWDVVWLGEQPDGAVVPLDTVGEIWLRGLLARAHKNTAVVALANKLARIAWALMTKGSRYRQPAALRV